jgi:hypothetical protein
LRENDPFRSNLTKPNAGRGFYEAIEPRFNRLVIFDDRLPHAVDRVDGPMDPVEGRFVLHGHLSEAGPVVTGALPANAVLEPIVDAVRSLFSDGSPTAAFYHGPLVLRLSINPGGSVKDCDVLLDRVMHRDPNEVGWENLRARLINRLSELKYPQAGGETIVLQPLIFNGSVS